VLPNAIHLTPLGCEFSRYKTIKNATKALKGLQFALETKERELSPRTHDEEICSNPDCALNIWDSAAKCDYPFHGFEKGTRVVFCGIALLQKMKICTNRANILRAVENIYLKNYQLQISCTGLTFYRRAIERLDLLLRTLEALGKIKKYNAFGIPIYTVNEHTLRKLCAHMISNGDDVPIELLEENGDE
jgi:hypothetical protein